MKSDQVIKTLVTCDGAGKREKATVLLNLVYAIRNGDIDSTEFNTLEDTLTNIKQP